MKGWPAWTVFVKEWLDALRDRVDQMEQWCTDRREMDLQMKLHHWLHGWLLLHVPFSFALLVMTVWHIYIVFTFL